MASMMEQMMGGEGYDDSSSEDSDVEDELLRNDPLLGGMYNAQYGAAASANSSSAKTSNASSGSGSGSGSIRVGDTVKVVDGCLAKVAFIGEVHYAKGEFAGLVMQDKSKGKNDGSVKGQRYFTCAKGQGLMVKARDVTKVR